ncbi:hypothetical protein DFS34DRAFT_624987 [Phlyctochytrium arcticum]|nr:hypothetical protein DFS34DRAFT_624987 [Phlyctochytrium arcticum]
MELLERSSSSIINIAWPTPRNRFEYYTLKCTRFDGCFCRHDVMIFFSDSNPTLLLISGSTDMKKSSGSSKSVPIVIGAYVSSPWKKSKQYWGNSDTILFQVEPRPSVHTAGTKTPVASSVKGNPVVPPPGSENYCYLNADAIGFGGTVNHFEFWTDLNRARFGPSIDEKAPGRLSSPIFGGWSDNVEFEVEDVEIIGLGTAHASAQQRREWNVDARAAERRQGVNVNDRDVARTVLAMAGVVPEERPE